MLTTRVAVKDGAKNVWRDREVILCLPATRKRSAAAGPRFRDNESDSLGGKGGGEDELS